jgi:hypothetical protein
MEYVLWTLVGLVFLYLAVRLTLRHYFPPDT